MNIPSPRDTETAGGAMLWMALACSTEEPVLIDIDQKTAPTWVEEESILDTAACSGDLLEGPHYTDGVCDFGPPDCGSECLLLEELLPMLAQRPYQRTDCEGDYTRISFVSDVDTYEVFGFHEGVIIFRTSRCEGCEGSYCCGGLSLGADVPWQYGSWPLLVDCQTAEIAPEL